MKNTKESILKKVFGYETFRSVQADIIDEVIAGKNALVLMPTGGGKSLCYQIPALLMDGICIVISPLIALMKDQVEALKSNGVAASYCNSTLTYAQQREVEEDCKKGNVKLLYVSPEKLFSEGYTDFLKSLKINSFAIDEAHCVSFWGHDFRPEYIHLSKITQQFKVPVIALTATADKITRKDIVKQLGIEDAKVFISSFDRPNLALTVLPGQKRLQKIQDFLKDRKDEAGIIYCLSRKTCEEVAEKLRFSGYNAKHYHAKMDHEYRSSTQEEFLKDNIQIICATIAFGMGIDKSNVRWVIHYNMPKNIESFYQEIGRAGRDGLKSETLLFYSFADYLAQMDMLKNIPAERKEIQEAKLERMKQYAESEVCRRRILISYFNEVYDQDCGSCDVCENPPQRIDASVLAQKALSAVARAEEKISITLLIDLLRGSMNKNITDRELHLLKTFGAGRELRPEEWSFYISQFINCGIIDIAYDENHHLKLNALSWEVLRKGKSVPVARFIPYSAKSKKEDKSQSGKPKKEVLFENLLNTLKKLRKELADQQNVPAYIIFNDNTLFEMARHKPTTEIEMLEISGVGHQKFNLYGEYFIQEIINFIKEESNKGAQINGSTYLITLELFQQGYNIEQIANQRNINQVTVISHLCTLYEKGYQIDLRKYINEEELKTIERAIEIVKPENKALKPVYEYLGGNIDYSKIRIATTLLHKII